MKVKLLKDQKVATMKPPIKATRGFACFSEIVGEDFQGCEEFEVSMSKAQAEELCKWLNGELYGINIQRTGECHGVPDPTP